MPTNILTYSTCECKHGASVEIALMNLSLDRKYIEHLCKEVSMSVNFKEDQHKMLILGAAITLILKDEFSEYRLDEILTEVFGENFSYYDFFESADEIKLLASRKIREIRNEGI